MIETEFGKRMWEEYKKVLNEAENGQQRESSDNS